MKGGEKSPLFILCWSLSNYWLGTRLGAASRVPREYVAEGIPLIFNGRLLAEETYSRISRNHRASDDQYNDYNGEFHLALTIEKPALSLGRPVGKTRVRKWRRESGGTLILEKIPDSDIQTEFHRATSASEKTSAVNASTAAPLRHASSGSPALRQVCSRKVSRSQPCSTGT